MQQKKKPPRNSCGQWENREARQGERECVCMCVCLCMYMDVGTQNEASANEMQQADSFSQEYLNVPKTLSRPSLHLLSLHYRFIMCVSNSAFLRAHLWLVPQIFWEWINKYAVSQLKHKSSVEAKCHSYVFIKTGSNGNTFSFLNKCSNY